MKNPNNQDLLERLQRSDRDTLIRVETKLDNITIELKNMSDGNTERFADHELRLRKIEDIIIQSNPTKNVNRLDTIEQRVNKFETTAVVLRLVSGVTGGLVVFILTQLPTWLQILGIVK